MFGTGDHDAARGRRLCFPTRSLWAGRRLLIWLDVVSRHSDGNTRRGCNRLCEISRCLCSGSRAGELPGETDSVGRSLRDQFIDRATDRDRFDRIADLDQHARPRDRQARAEYIHVREDGGARGSRSDRLVAGLERKQRRTFIRVVGFVGKRVEPPNRPAWFGRRWRACACLSFWQSNGRPAFCANRLDQRHVYRQRSARPGAQPRARIVGRLRDRRRLVSAS